MSSRRVLKAAEAIREVVGMAILTELRDPRVRDVTVTHVEVSGDMRTAKVHVSVMGNQTRQELSLRGLRAAAGFLQAKVAERIDTRYTPRLEFVLDQGVKNSLAVAQILRDLAAERLAQDQAAPAESAEQPTARPPGAGPPPEGEEAAEEAEEIGDPAAERPADDSGSDRAAD